VRRNQYILLGSGLLFTGFLYFYGNRKGDSSPKPASTHQDGAARDMMNPSADIPVLDFPAYAKEAQNKLDEAAKKQAIRLAEKAETDKTAIAYKDAAEFWEKQKELNMTADNYKKAAFLENTEKSVTFAGNLFLAVMQKTEKPEIRKWQALEAIGCFNKVLELNPENTEAKIALATCYTEGTGETMKGVTLLREVTQKDSNNISANIILGKLAIQSGQFDKLLV
jgi:tetratricopeptide (TPR) repeat protein